MKNSLFVFIFLLFSINAAFGQFRIGPLAGLSVSKFIYDDNDYKEAYLTRYKPGFQLGMMLNYRVSKLYSLHTELSFLKKGINVRNKDEFREIQNNANYYYLSVPALLRFSSHKMIGNQHVEFYVNVGPEVNYWLGGNGSLRTTEPSPFIKDEQLNYTVRFRENDLYGTYMVVEEPSKIQMALGAGGGVIFEMARNQNLGIDLRGSFGVGKSFHGKEEGGDYGLQLYNENLAGVHHTISVTASYIYNFDLNTFLRKGKVAQAY